MVGGRVKTELGCATVGQLAQVPRSKLSAVFGEGTASMLERLAHGEDDAEVQNRYLPKSIGCGKTFRNAYWGKGISGVGMSVDERAKLKNEDSEIDHGHARAGTSRTLPQQGPSAAAADTGGVASSPSPSKDKKGWVLQDMSEVEYWIRGLSNEAAERLDKDRDAHGRVARSLTVSLTNVGVHASRVCKLRYGQQHIYDDAMATVHDWNRGRLAALPDTMHRAPTAATAHDKEAAKSAGLRISSLYLSGSDFVDVGGAGSSIVKFMRPLTEEERLSQRSMTPAGEGGSQGAGAGGERPRKRAKWGQQQLLSLVATPAGGGSGGDGGVVISAAQMVSVVGCGEATARRYLADAGGCVEAAVDAYFTDSITATTDPAAAAGTAAASLKSSAVAAAAAEVVAGEVSTISPQPVTLDRSLARSPFETADIDTIKYLSAPSQSGLDQAAFFELPCSLRTDMVREWKRSVVVRAGGGSGRSSQALGTRKISSFFQ